jgi:hypothetical protein
MESRLNIYCTECNAITDHRQKGLRDTANVCNVCDATNSLVTIIKSTGERKRGSLVKFVEFDGDEIGSRAKQLHEEPEVGFSCVLDPQYASYTWLTTPIKEIESDITNGSIRTIVFKTQNSNYTLYIVNDESKTL